MPSPSKKAQKGITNKFRILCTQIHQMNKYKYTAASCRETLINYEKRAREGEGRERVDDARMKDCTRKTVIRLKVLMYYSCLSWELTKLPTIH
jgi:hypothetical protein